MKPKKLPFRKPSARQPTLQTFEESLGEIEALLPVLTKDTAADLRNSLSAFVKLISEVEASWTLPRTTRPWRPRALPCRPLGPIGNKGGLWDLFRDAKKKEDRALITNIRVACEGLLKAAPQETKPRLRIKRVPERKTDASPPSKLESHDNPGPPPVLAPQGSLHLRPVVTTDGPPGMQPAFLPSEVKRVVKHIRGLFADR